MPIASYVLPASRQSSPWVVLCHAFAADHRMWDGQIDWLRQHYHVLSYDLRGHGHSKIDTGESAAAACSLRDLEDEALGVMDQHGVAEATFIGLSLGGNIGLGLALRQPERITQLVCCNARGDMPPPARASWDERMEIVRQKGTAALIDITLPRWLSETTRSQNPEIVALVGEMIAGTSSAGYLACAQALRDMAEVTGLESLRVPVAYITGELDFAAAPAAVEALANKTPQASFDGVPGASHLSNLDQPAAFQAILRQRLALV